MYQACISQYLAGSRGLTPAASRATLSDNPAFERPARALPLVQMIDTMDTPHAPHARGLSFMPATSLEAVQEAWELVYDRYVDKGLITPNRAGLHLAPQALSSRTLVVCCKCQGVTVSTMTAIPDAGNGVPLDSVYAPTLNRLRDQGRTFTEVGLFADRREQSVRSAAALFDLMRWVYWYAYHRGSDEVIIGVHPAHARFYERCFGAISFDKLTVYPTVNNHPVLPMRLDVRGVMELPALPRGIQYFMNNRLEPRHFKNRFNFNFDDILDSRVHGYIREKYTEPRHAHGLMVGLGEYLRSA